MENYILLKGDSRAIILFHAYTGTPKDVKMLGEYLHTQGYTVFMPLFLGHGSDDMRNILNTNFDEWIKQAEDAVDFLKYQGYQQIAVFGLSMGGMVAFHLLLHHQDVIGGGSFNSPIPLSDYQQVENMFLWLAQQKYQEKFGDFEQYHQEITDKLKRQLTAIQEKTEQLIENFHKIDKNIYIAQSGADELIDCTIGQSMANQLMFAAVDFHYFEHAKHVITIGAYRKVFQETVLNFVNRLDWRKDDKTK